MYFQDFLSSEEARVEYWDQKLEALPSFRNARPNAVHSPIADLEGAGKLCMVLTQNIDGLHERAGTSPERLVEHHGTNRWVGCVSCRKRNARGWRITAFYGRQGQRIRMQPMNG